MLIQLKQLAIVVSLLILVVAVTSSTIAGSLSATPDPCPDGMYPLTDSNGEIATNPYDGGIECVPGP